MEKVSLELIKSIRMHINRTEKQAKLLSNRNKWMRLTSALDTLEDTAWAIEYYIDSSYPDNTNGKYLFTYGLLQALFVQEDAISSINKALFDKDVDYKADYPTAFKVREMRNDVIGHPTNRNGNTYIYLAQCSLSKEHFYYIKETGSDMGGVSIDVDVFAAIEDVAKCVNNILETAVKDLDDEFRAYIDEHRERKMEEIFNTLMYAREKALLDTHMCDWGYNTTKTMVQKCEDELVLRYGTIEAVDSYKYLLEEIHEIYDLLDDGIPRLPSDIKAMVKKHLLQHLFCKMEELKKYCAETDSYFENYGEEPLPDAGDAPKVIFINEDSKD